MRPLPKAFLIIVLFACVLIAGFLLPRQSRELTVSAPGSVPHGPTRVPISAVPNVSVWPDLDVFARLGAEETLGAISAELERVQSFVESIPVPAVVTSGPVKGAPENSARVSAPGGGGIDFEGLANCEGSGINGWRTGLYGLETNTNDVGSWSIEAQQAKVREIYAQYGATAWGTLCQRFFGG